MKNKTEKTEKTDFIEIKTEIGKKKTIELDGPVDPFPNPKLCPTGAASTINAGRYGCSRDGGTQWHGGTDLKAAIGTELIAIYGGEIKHIRDLKPTDPEYKNGVGSFIIVRTGKFSIKYCHLSEISVSLYATIKAGDKLGKTGASGNAYNVPNKHLHIEVSEDHFETNTQFIDPESKLKTKYKADGSVGDPGINPNNNDHSKCQG